MLNDIRYAIRLLRHSPGFTTVATLSLALGIGANTALFSIVDATLFKPLPFADPEGLVDILEVQRKGTAEQVSFSGMTRSRVSAWRAQTHIFEAIETARPGPRLLIADTPLRLAQVSRGLFPMLGVTPALGRNFTEQEAAHGDHRVIILSDGFWRRAFGADSSIVGRDVRLGERTMTVIGVMPKEARYPLGGRTDGWLPLTSVIDPADPSSGYVGIVARLRPGLSVASAQPLVEEAAAAIQAATPARRPWSAELAPLDPRTSSRGTQPLILVAFGAVTFVLLTACAGIANMLLARASSRRRELAVRAALGASRWRLARQLLLDGLLVAVAGGTAGALISFWLIDALPLLLPSGFIPYHVYDVQLDGRVQGFTVFAAMMAGLASGMLPALRGSRERGACSLGSAATIATSAPEQRRAGSILLFTQVTLAVVLLTGAVLFSSSFARMVLEDPGFQLEGLQAIAVNLPAEKYLEPVQSRLLFDQFLGMARSTPGVRRATLGTPPPTEPSSSMAPEHQEDTPYSQPRTLALTAGPDYFAVLGIRIVAGRPFNRRDEDTGGASVIVDRDAADQFWPGADPIGKRVRLNARLPWRTVVGVAANVKTNATAHGRHSFEVYVPFPRQPSRRAALLFRADGDATAPLATLRAKLLSLEPEAVVVSAGSVEDLYGPALATPRFAALVMSLFAGLALLTTTVGLYGVLSYSVAQRTSEIGLRMALGADRRDIRRLVVAGARWPVLGGLVLGLVAARWLTRVAETQLYLVTPEDPLTHLVVAGVFLSIVALAAYAPARRAARVDPLVALRTE